MPELNNQFPEWLRAKYAKGSGEGSPWLASAIQESRQQRELPLRIQQMALQNESSKLAIVQQGMENEIKGLQMQGYREEYPRFAELQKQYANDPVGIMNHPNTFANPMLQARWAGLQTNAAKTMAGLAAMENVKARWQAATKLLEGGAPPLELDQQGNPSPEWLEKAGAAVQANELEIRSASLRSLDPSQVALNDARTQKALADAARPPSAGSAPSAVAEARALTAAQEALDAATTGGNPVEIAKAERELANLNTAFKRKYQDPASKATLTILRMGITNIDRQLHSPMASILMKDEEKAEMLAERAKLQEQIDGLGAAGSEAPAAASATGEVKEIGGFKVRVKKP